MNYKYHSLYGLTTYYIKADLYEDMVEMLDSGKFLTLKAEVLGIDSLTDDLENIIIPEIIQHEDWNRFARYITMVINLKGLADQLSQEIVLFAMVSNNQFDFSLSIIKQIQNPISRIKAFGTLLHVLEDPTLIITQKEFHLLQVQNILEENLHQINSRKDISFIDLISTLVFLLEKLNFTGYTLVQPFLIKIENHQEQNIDFFWKALIKVITRDYMKYQLEIRRFLKKIQSVQQIVKIIENIPIFATQEEWSTAITLVEDLHLPNELTKELCFCFILKFPKKQNLTIWQLFQKYFPDNKIHLEHYNPRLVQLFCSSLTDEQIKKLLDSNNFYETKLTIAVYSYTSIISTKSQNRWINSLKEDSQKLHWLIQISKINCDSNNIFFSNAMFLASQNNFLFYNSEDTLSFINLVALFEPRLVSKYLDLIASSSNTTSDAMITIAGKCKNPIIIEHFINNIDNYVGCSCSIIGASTKFAYRRTLLLELLYNCSKHGLLFLSKEIIESRLFGPEIDAIFPIIMKLINEGYSKSVVKLLTYLQDPKLKFLVKLSLLGKEDSELFFFEDNYLSFCNIYSIFFDKKQIDDQLLYNEMICEHPANVLQTKKRITKFHNNKYGTNILFELAENNLDYQNKKYRENNIQYAITSELCIEAMSLLHSEKELVNHTPIFIKLILHSKQYISTDDLIESIKRIFETTDLQQYTKLNTLCKIVTIYKEKLSRNFSGTKKQSFLIIHNITNILNSLYYLSENSNGYLQEQIDIYWPIILLLFYSIPNELCPPNNPDQISHFWQANLSYNFSFLFHRVESVYYSLLKLENKFFPASIQNFLQQPWQNKFCKTKNFSNYMISNFDDLLLDYNSLPENDISYEISDLYYRFGQVFYLAKHNPNKLLQLLHMIPNSESKNVIISRLIFDEWIVSPYSNQDNIKLASMISNNDNLQKLLLEYTTNPINNFNKNSSIESRLIEYSFCLEDEWFHYDVKHWLKLISKDISIDFSELSKQVLECIRENRNNCGDTTFLKWLYYYLLPSSSEYKSKEKIINTKETIHRAESILVPEIKDEKRTNFTPINLNNIKKYKLFTSKLSHRIDQFETNKEGLIQISLLILIMYSGLLLYLDIPLISKEPINHIYSIPPSPAIWIFFIIFPIINIWLIGSALYIQRVHDRNLLLFGKIFIVIFSGIPIWGLLAFPIYSYLISNDIFSQPSYPYKSNTKIKLSFLLRKYIDILCWKGFTYWKKIWIWWGLLANFAITFFILYYFLDTYFPMHYVYHKLWLLTDLFFHILLFSFAFYILWNSSENGNANQIIARWLRCMGAFLWLVPVPGVPFSGLLYISAFYHTHSREHTITYQAFENMKSMFRDPIWPKLKNQFEYEFRKLNFIQRFRSYPFHNSRIQQNTNKKILSCFSLRIRALSSAGTASWVIWLLFLFKLDFHIIENVYGLLAMISLIFTILSLLLYLTQYIVMTVKRKLAFQEHPYSYYIFLSQIGFLAGTCISFGYKTNDTIFITPISFVCLILILLKLLQTILGIFIDLPEDEDQIPFESLFFTVILISFVTTSMDLPSYSNNPIDQVMLIDKSLRYLLPILTLLITYNFHSYFMSPFGWNEINTKNLPQRIRVLLTIVSLSFVFPFGEFLLPFYIYLKEHYWTKFEKLLIDQ